MSERRRMEYFCRREPLPAVQARFEATPILIYSGEHGAYWRPDCAGYIRSPEGAGRYSLREAIDATRHCGPEKRISFERTPAMTPSPAPPRRRPMAETFAWLIEAPGPRYLAVREVPKMYGEFIWTDDPNKALRFWSKEQCDKTMLAIRRMDPPLFGFEVTLGNAWPREHGWV